MNDNSGEDEGEKYETQSQRSEAFEEGLHIYPEYTVYVNKNVDRGFDEEKEEKEQNGLEDFF